MKNKKTDMKNRFADTGKSFAEVAADSERDNYMSAQEALAYGLIDKIIGKR